MTSDRRPPVVDGATVEIEGPWEHRHVSANGARFHVAELGEGPLVLLLHGFPQFWYAWRHQMLALADEGYRVAAMDLRGYGGSDKPPRGYDTYTGAADAASVVRALGESSAVIVGQGLGAWIAWTMPTLQPTTTQAIATLSCPHPRVMRAALRRSPRQREALRWGLSMQLPFRPERRLTRSDDCVRERLQAGASPLGEWPTDEDVERYAAALRIPFVAHSAAEHFRWLGRSTVRPDGPRFMHAIRHRITVPVLQLHGTEDRSVLPDVTGGSERFVGRDYAFEPVEGAGHFLSEESPQRVNALLLDWLDQIAPAGS